MVDDLIYAALTSGTLKDYLWDDDGWRVYPRGSLGYAGVPSNPRHVYAQYGEGSAHPLRLTREIRNVLTQYYTIYVYDDAGSYSRIKEVHKLLLPAMIALSGQVSTSGTKITECILNEYGQDGNDSVGGHLVKLATYTLITSDTSLEPAH